MPATFVSTGLNSPRNSFGASGFKSNVSMCEGPPPRYTLMIDFLEYNRSSLCWSSACNRPASESPPNPAAPICRKFRREIPSQYRDCEPQTVNMADSLSELNDTAYRRQNVNA